MRYMNEYMSEYMRYMSDVFRVKVIQGDGFPEIYLIGQIVEVIEFNSVFYKVVSGEYNEMIIYKDNCKIYNLDKIIKNI